MMILGVYMASIFDSNRFGAGAATLATAARSIGSISGVATGTLGSIGGAANRLSGALNNLAAAGGIISAIRSINIPSKGEPSGKINNAAATFSDSDWRVRLSIPSIDSFSSSPILAPLRAAGGAVFPYTPTIRISNSANYDATKPLHQNFAFQSYVNSQADSINITAPFYCEDSTQAAYWVSMLHFLRSVTKMFSGQDALAGNPPPILYFSAYGDFVFKNIPVVVTNVSVDLDAASDYIATDMSQAADNFGAAFGLADATVGILGAINPRAGAALGRANNIIQGVKGVADSFKRQLANAGGGTSGGKTYVPTKSTMTVQLQPIYSRDSARTFSLQKFVNGDYVKSNGTGYI
jgi:hypothetical protein